MITGQLANVHKRQSARMDLSLYKNFLGRLGRAAFALPGDIDLFVRAEAPVASNTLAMRANGKNYYVGPRPGGPARPTGYVRWLGRFGDGTIVAIQPGFQLCIDAGLGRYIPVGSGGWSMMDLFRNSEQGLWYDPADLTDAKVNWRKNQLLYSEQLASANWTKVNVNIQENVAAAPGGLFTADKIVENTVNGSHSVTQSTASAGIPTVAGQAYTGYARLKKAERGFAFVGFNGGGILYFISLDLTTGTSFVAASQAGVTYEVIALADGWFDVFVYATAVTSASMPLDVRTSIDGVWGNRSYTGDGASGIFMAAASVMPGTTKEYQRITDGGAQDFMRLHPTHTLFQDSLCQVPVMSMEQLIGCILDKRFGGLRGAEALSPQDIGPYTSVGNWSTLAGASSLAVVNGEIVATLLGTGSTWVTRRSNVPLLGGTAYECQFETRVSAPLNIGVSMNFYNETTASSVTGVTTASSNSLSNTEHRLVFVAPTTGLYSFIVNRSTASAGDNGKTVTLSRASIRPIVGNHATQATTPARPILSARVNKCLNFNANPVDLSGTTKTGDTAAVLSIVDDTAALAAAGLSSICTTGKVYRLDNSLGTGTAWVAPDGFTGNLNTHTLSIYGRRIAGAGGRLDLQGILATFSNNEFARIVGTGAPTITNARMLVAAPAGAIIHFILNQLEEGTTVSARPQVTTGASYDATGWPRYFKFDGVDDMLSTLNADFTTYSQIAIWIGRYASPSSATAMLLEQGTDANSVNNTFALVSPSVSDPGRISLIARGNASAAGAVATGLPVPRYDVLSAFGDLSTAVRNGIVRRNGVEVASTGTSTGGGTFSNLPLFFGGRSGTTLRSDMKCYGIVARGGTVTTAQLTQAEQYLNTLMGKVY